MTITPDAKPLASQDDLDDVIALAQGAHDGAEAVEWCVERICSDWEEKAKAPEVMPTFEDIGRLYVFADQLRQYGGLLTKIAEKLIGTEPYSQLSVLDIVREANAESKAA